MPYRDAPLALDRVVEHGPFPICWHRLAVGTVCLLGAVLLIEVATQHDQLACARDRASATCEVRRGGAFAEHTVESFAADSVWDVRLATFDRRGRALARVELVDEFGIALFVEVAARGRARDVFTQSRAFFLDRSIDRLSFASHRSLLWLALPSVLIVAALWLCVSGLRRAGRFRLLVAPRDRRLVVTRCILGRAVGSRAFALPPATAIEVEEGPLDVLLSRFGPSEVGYRLALVRPCGDSEPLTDRFRRGLAEHERTARELRGLLRSAP